MPPTIAEQHVGLPRPKIGNGIHDSRHFEFAFFDDVPHVFKTVPEIRQGEQAGGFTRNSYAPPLSSHTRDLEPHQTCQPSISFGYAYHRAKRRLGRHEAAIVDTNVISLSSKELRNGLYHYWNNRKLGL